MKRSDDNVNNVYARIPIADLDDSKQFAFTGYTFSSVEFAALTIYDNLNNILLRINDTKNTAYYQKIFVLPENSSYIIINGVSKANCKLYGLIAKEDNKIHIMQPGEDFNDFTQSCIITIANTSNLLHAPKYNIFYTNTGICLVYRSNVIYQIYIQQLTGSIHTRYATLNDGINFTPWVSDETLCKPFPQNGNFNNLHSGKYSIIKGRNPSNCPDNTEVGTLEVDYYKQSTNEFYFQRYTQTYTGKLFTRLGRNINNNFTWDEWASESNKHVKMLFIGNSLTQDGTAYLPYLLKTYYPEVNFDIYMWYNGGIDLSWHYNNWLSDGKANIFSVARNSASWTNYNNSLTMLSVLQNYKFDIVSLQEYFNYKTSYTNLNTYNNVVQYIINNYTGGNPLKFVSLMHRPRIINDNTYTTKGIRDLSIQGIKMMLKEGITQDIIPVGEAAYMALEDPVLDALGDSQHLSCDGTHAQEGLPCILQTLTELLWLFDTYNINNIGIYNHPVRITEEIYNSLNIPGANLGTGIITGTDEENLHAQRIAILANNWRKTFISNIFND